MAHTKAGGSTHLGRDSQSKRLGIKVAAGETVRAGMILIRQRGSKIHAGTNTRTGKDDTIYAKIGGVVKFTSKKVRSFNGRLTQRSFIHIQ